MLQLDNLSRLISPGKNEILRLITKGGKEKNTGMVEAQAECSAQLSKTYPRLFKAKSCHSTSSPSPISSTAIESRAVAELDLYMRKGPPDNMGTDPMKFWLKYEKEFPLLSSVAFDILVIPATSAPVERIFSQISYACAGLRNQLSAESLRAEMFIKCNAWLMNRVLAADLIATDH